MNNQEITALVREDVVTVQGVFTRDGGSRGYTFFMLQELAGSVEIGDLVLAETANGVSIVEVRSFDDVLGTGTLRDDIQYRYVFDVVDQNKLVEIKRQNKIVEDKLQKFRKEKAKYEALVAMGAQTSDDLKQLMNDIKGEITHATDN